MSPGLADSGLRCPACEYNLTGIDAPRCPECGVAVDLDELRRRLSIPAPALAFERARGWKKIPGFVATWVVSLFAPKWFARQVLQRIDARHAWTFGAICFAGTLVAFLFGCDLALWLAWMITAGIYLVIQTFVLASLDWSGYREWKRSLGFWAKVGGYTSAVMFTEFAQGPPLLMFEDLLNFFTYPYKWLTAGAWPRTFGAPFTVVQWSQLFFWLLALSWCFGARIGRRGRGVFILMNTLFVFGVVLCLYSLVVEHIGARIYEALDDLI